MDVFIPEEYVARRRAEKRAAAAGARKRADIASPSDSGRRRAEERENKAQNQKPYFQLRENEYLVCNGSGLGESIVHSCSFSA